YLLILVGSGIGPAILAPVRLAVSTISPADWSSSLWSYALSRMRMRGVVMASLVCWVRSVDDLGDDPVADGLAALADREAQPVLARDRRHQLHVHLDVVARHHHLHPGGQRHRSRHVRRPEVELRPVSVEERRVPPALFLLEHVHLCLELGVRLD